MNEFWFKPKTFGYGATPATWEGWAVVAVFVAIVLLCSVMLTVHRQKLFTLSPWSVTLLLATVTFVAVCWWKTDGSWHWSWGASEIAEKR